jgi:hypothetical protein
VLGDLGASVFSATLMLFSGWDTDDLSDALSPTLATCHYIVCVILMPFIMLNLLVRCLPEALVFANACASILSGVGCVQSC